MISRHLVVPLTHSPCQFACKNLILKNSSPHDPPLPPEKDDHQFFIFMRPNSSLWHQETWRVAAVSLHSPHIPHIPMTDRQTEGQTPQPGYILRRSPLQAADAKKLFKYWNSSSNISHAKRHIFKWVSEQFLNGTSAHRRPFQCHSMVLRLKTKYI